MSKLIVALAIIFASSPALAFHEIESYARSANTGGGANYYYTGSPRYKGYDCNICHTFAEKKISIGLQTVLTSGDYQAGLIYRLDVQLIGEHKGLESAFNPNTFAVDILDDSGQPLGRLVGGSSSIVEGVDDGRVALAEGFGEGETEWSFTWWAPDTAVPATIYMAMVDGDGASDPENRFIDPMNDDVALLTLRLCPGGETCSPLAVEPPDEKSPTSCTIASAGSSSALLVVLLLLGWRRRERLDRI